MFMGLLYVVPLWAFQLKPAPVLTTTEVKSLIPIAILHSLVHIGI